MNANELLDVMGDVRESYVMEAQEYRTGRQTISTRSAFRRALLIAAVITLLVAMVGFAAIVFNLDSLIMGHFGDEQPMDYLSLQGFSGSKNYLAAQEWQEFLDSYDPDRSLRDEAEKTGYIAPEAYESYMCYTDEMVQKIDELCKKYGLNLLGPIQDFDNVWNVLDETGVHKVLDSDRAGICQGEGYYYRDGTFQISGIMELCGENVAWRYPIDFQYRCVMKTSFDGVYINVWDTASYDQWSYTNAEGTKLLLALSENHALIIADKDDFFVTLSILNPFDGEQQMSRSVMESIADALTFDYTPQGVSEQVLPTVDPEAVQTPGYELFEAVFLPVANGTYGNTLDEIGMVLTQLGYEYRLDEGMLSVEDKKTGKWLGGTLTNQNVTVELADLTYCHVEGEQQYRVKVNLYTDVPEYYIEDAETFAETRLDTLADLAAYIYNCG